ncbi:FAD binding domain-containing protein [Chitinophaga pinensis]|uniref:Molybdopterin dehydrogenase FAD-binding n=1 Tax=Chitinophaga pinensis (strain ATCC 43595 / DSM 2588 / LMG 13176 / NBRC 15968 / NCIMB 11800 / UQM 2034) TaxID=485918 RepID=A0A979G2H5_CHIPD|nr:xanthine dehydrogenase family protein subunit M [Chitinophaga pinensis]ACU59650.1 molybdopterin dehydrogenase FAD-binding [Chitinophaga pinensis DSM 2588]
MNNFTYTEASDIDNAVNEMAGHAAAMFVAGGTNLIDLMKENVLHPGHLIDINRLHLDSIELLDDGRLFLGALATNADTAWHSLVEKRYPLLADAILAGASPQLRNMATNGGNLMQRTRCYYFYDTSTPCNKRLPGSGCSALRGYNRIHAIMGTSQECIAVHPSDMCVALRALNAVIQVRGQQGERLIPIADFHRLAGDTPHIDNNLAHDELITGIILPNERFTANYKYLKVRDRASYAFALVSVAVVLQLEGDIISNIRIAMGGVAHKPWRDESVEAELKGKSATIETFAAAADRILKDAVTFGTNDFKPALAKRAIIRACKEALNREK